MSAWPPQKTLSTWTIEGPMTQDTASITVTATGDLNWSSTGTTAVLDTNTFSAIDMSFMVTGRTTPGSDTFQLNGSNDNSNWLADDALLTFGSGVATPFGKAWPAKHGYRYYKLTCTLASVSITIQMHYTLLDVL